MPNLLRVQAEIPSTPWEPSYQATQPFGRLNIHFKGPLPSNNKNVYFLNVIDEYSRFPFVFPCPDMTAGTVMKCLTLLFTVFGMPAYVHSDRGPSLVSQELHAFLAGKGVAVSHTTAYNPAGNGQVEKYNGTVWKAITMACKTKNLHIKHLELTLPMPTSATQMAGQQRCPLNI